MNRESLVPLTGLLFVVLLIAGFLVGGEPPDADSDAQEIVEHYVDNKDAVIAGVVLIALAAVSLVFFAGHLRKVLSAAEPGSGMLPGLVLVGASLIAVGGAIDGTISIALAEAAEDIDPVAVQALQALWDNDFVPIAVGIVVFLLASGLAIVRDGALPKWLGWAAIVFAVVGVIPPIGFAAFPATLLYIAIVSVILAVRAGREAGTPAQ